MTSRDRHIIAHGDVVGSINFGDGTLSQIPSGLASEADVTVFAVTLACLPAPPR